MQPMFNPFHQTNTNSLPVNPQMQVLSTNPLQNSIQIQPQIATINPQFPIPYNNSNALLNNGQAVPNMLPFMTQQQPGNFMNANAALLGILQMGLYPQNPVNNLNGLGMFLNQCQLQGQILAPNLSNQNMGFPNLQNPMQNMNPIVPVQLPNPSQVAPFNIPPGSHQVGGPQDPNFLVKSLLGVGQQVQPNQQNFLMSTVGANASQPLHIASQQLGGNSSALQQGQNSQPRSFNRRQGNGIKNAHHGNPNSNWKNTSRKDLKKDLNRGASQSEHQKPHFRHMDYRKRKFGFSKEHKGKGHGHETAERFCHHNPVSQAREKKRPLALAYTEEEIKQWRDARRKNYPSKANIEQKQTGKVANAEVIDKEAKLRCEQLKEILAKQAELGVEVAEIPSYYLEDSRKDIQGGEDNRCPLTKKDKFRNKYGKRGRGRKKDQLAKQQTLAARSTSISANNNKKPTLLQKLLSADIRKDKRRLLQVFRFMTVNSFFKDWPENPLKFPLIVVKEDGCENEVMKEKSLLIGKDVSAVSCKKRNEKFGNVGDSGGDDSSEDDGDARGDIDLPEQVTCFTMEKGSLDGEGHRTEEEGEIVD